MKLRISSDLALPEEVVTATSVVYGGKGMGKSNLASVIMEEATKARLRWSALDPMGVLWGIRHSADGKGPGVECVILGGPHGDIPIEPTGGAIVADLVVDEDVNTIIDFSRKANGQMWTVGEKVRFVTDYTLRLFQRQGELVGGRRREPILQILDEAARYIPQVIPAGNFDLAKCVGAWEQVCEEGRNIGLGVAFITQRSARMNKSVSELADIMYAFRTVGPNSLRAVMDWLGSHVDKDRVKELAAQVRELDVGEALVVSPGWLRVEKVVRIRLRETFDSSATPKPGQRARRVTGAAAKPNLASYQTRMAETIERAKADDPKALRAEIVALKRDLAKKGADPADVRAAVDSAVARATDGKDAEIARAVAAAIKGKNADIASILNRLHSVHREATAAVTYANRALTHANNAVTLVGEIQLGIQDMEKAPATGTIRLDAPPTPLRARPPRPGDTVIVHDLRNLTSRAAVVGSARSGELPRPQQRVLDAIAQLNALGIDPPTRGNVGVWMGVSSDSGSFKNYLGGLRTLGFLEYPSEGTVALTPEGRAQADPGKTPLSLDALHSLWLNKLPAPQARILRLVLADYPNPISRAAIGQVLDVEHTAGSFKNYLGAMRSLGLIDYPGDGLVTATDIMFPTGLR